jgi:tRNA threonylcarbamoyladenosine biosynthesis protein TsaE
MKFTARTEADLKPVVEYLVSQSKLNKVFAFTGHLGAGKTTLIKQFCVALGVNGTVSSPTFSLVNEYAGTDETIYHFDFYRLNSPDEAYGIGFEEYLYSGSICLIEWPEMVDGLLPQTFILVKITVSDTDERELEINKTRSLNL